jgi:hypothetical protein
MQTNLSTQGHRLIGSAAALPITEKWLMIAFSPKFSILVSGL